MSVCKDCKISLLERAIDMIGSITVAVEKQDAELIGRLEDTFCEYVDEIEEAENAENN